MGREMWEGGVGWEWGVEMDFGVRKGRNVVDISE